MLITFLSATGSRRNREDGGSGWGCRLRGASSKHTEAASGSGPFRVTERHSSSPCRHSPLGISHLSLHPLHHPLEHEARRVHCGKPFRLASSVSSGVSLPFLLAE